MRIISGERRGQRFDGPKDRQTRPTSDLVRESIFNIVGGAVDGRLVLDLFAGTGALGFEALSRGAKRVIAVERNKDNVSLILRNLTTLRYDDRARVHMADAYRWAPKFDPGPDSGPVCVFIDPPYKDYDNQPEKVNRMLDELVRNLPDGSLLVVESSKFLDATILPDFDQWDLRRYGGTLVAFRVLGEDPGAMPEDDDPEDESIDEDEDDDAEDGPHGDDERDS